MNERKIAGFGAAGCFALSVATLGFYALLTGRASMDGFLIFGIWLIAGGLIHFACGVIGSLNNDELTSNAFMFYAAILMLVSGVAVIVKYCAAMNGWPLDPRIEGYTWITIWMSILLWTPAILKLYPSVMSLGLMPLNVAFPIIVFVNLGMISPSWLALSGYAHGLTGLVFLYLGGAFVVNTVFGREVMYLGRPLIK